MSWNIKTPGDYINGPLTVIGSATITGDVTVRTNQLVVNSSGSFVGKSAGGVGIDGVQLLASGFSGFSASATTALFVNRNTSDGTVLQLGRSGASAADFGAIAGGGFTVGLSGSEWMRINANGLGVGTSSIVNAAAGRGNVTIGGSSSAILNLSIGSADTGYVIHDGTSIYLVNRIAAGSLIFSTNSTERLRIDSSGQVGIGVSPAVKLDIGGAATQQFRIQMSGQADTRVISDTGAGIIGTYSNHKLIIRTNSADAVTVDASQNVGIGGAPSAKFHVSDANLYAPSLTWNTACAAIVRSENGQLATGSDSSGPYAIWMQVRTIGNSARDISLNPLGGNVIIGSRTANNGKLTVTETANSDAVQLIGSSGTFARFYGWSVDNTWNANAAAIFLGKQTSTSRSINAGGTVNASGADYAEYMTKGSDFVLSKGGIAGIDANGKLTNIFADAVSFVVKSTDPSYVGNDKWGVGLEGDALEAARQLVDRIAFAGQVPVNVTGAKAGDYIVPVVDGNGIKGIAVSNPTFEQYQLAVGKVIAIDADGRARIIVKVA